MKWFKAEPAAIGAAAAAVYAAVTMIYAVATHHGGLRPDVLVAAVSAVWALWTRSQVTPLVRPRGASGVPLVPYPAPATSSAASGLGDEPTS